MNFVKCWFLNILSNLNEKSAYNFMHTNLNLHHTQVHLHLYVASGADILYVTDVVINVRLKQKYV